MGGWVGGVGEEWRKGKKKGNVQEKQEKSVSDEASIGAETAGRGRGREAGRGRLSGVATPPTPIPTIGFRVVLYLAAGGKRYETR